MSNTNETEVLIETTPEWHSMTAAETVYIVARAKLESMIHALRPLAEIEKAAYALGHAATQRELCTVALQRKTDAATETRTTRIMMSTLATIEGLSKRIEEAAFSVTRLEETQTSTNTQAQAQAVTQLQDKANKAVKETV